MGSKQSQNACRLGHTARAVCLVAALLALAPPARAEDYNSAAGRLAQGYNQFFEAVRKAPADAAVSGHYNDFVAEPAQAVQQAQIDSSRSVMQKMGIKVIKTDSAAREPASASDSGGGSDDLSWVWGKEKKEPVSRAPARAAGEDTGYSVSAPAAAPAAPALEPVIVDGSEVPRELEFPGPKR